MEISLSDRLLQGAINIGAFAKKENYFFKWRYVMPAMAMLLLYIFLGKDLKGAITVSILAIAASYSTIYKRVIRIPSAIELVVLGTVITSISYGPVAGAIFGVTTTIASEVISAAVDLFTFVYAFARGVIGVVAYFLAGMDIVLLGVLMTLLFNGICQPVYLLPGDFETKMKAVYFFTMNITFNFIAFFFLGNFLLSVTA